MKTKILLLISLFFVLLYLIQNNAFFSTKLKSRVNSERQKMSDIISYAKNNVNFNEKCDKFYSPYNISITWSNKIWQNLQNNSKFFLYSAFIDSRLGMEQQVVRVLAMSKGQFNQQLYCRIWQDNNKTAVYELEIQEMWIYKWDNAKPQEYYRPLMLSCPISGIISPVAISIVYEPCEMPTNIYWLSIDDDKINKKDFVVCLKPIYFEEDISNRLMEWMELQFILGANKISFYIYHIHPNTHKILKYYEDLGQVSLTSHKIPDQQFNESLKLKQYLIQNTWQKRRYEILTYNDCFYKHMKSHKFVVILDLDEAIIPLIHDSWHGLVNQAFEENPDMLSHASSLSASNVYFFDKFGEIDDETIPWYMHMLRHVYRSANFTPPGFAMKSFFSTNNTSIVFNHYALSSLEKFNVNVPLSKNFVHLHHYRKKCPPLMKKECLNNYMKFKIKDTIVWKFKDILIKNVNYITDMLNLNFNKII